MALSDDKINEDINRTLADADVPCGIALDGLHAAMEQAGRAFTDFGVALMNLVEASEAELTDDQRVIYDALVLCGTPRMDAVCDACDLATPVRLWQQLEAGDRRRHHAFWDLFRQKPARG